MTYCTHIHPKNIQTQDHNLKNINGLNRSKNIKKGYSKFSIAFCSLLQRMMDFCKVRRILISCIDVIVYSVFVEERM